MGMFREANQELEKLPPELGNTELARAILIDRISKAGPHANTYDPLLHGALHYELARYECELGNLEAAKAAIKTAIQLELLPDCKKRTLEDKSLAPIGIRSASHASRCESIRKRHRRRRKKPVTKLEKRGRNRCMKSKKASPPPSKNTGKLKDLKPKKDAKGGGRGGEPGVIIQNHNETLL